MKPEYEQLKLDTRPALLKAITAVTTDAVETAHEMTVRHNVAAAEEGQHVPGPVRNRHEAYGIAAEQMGKINSAVKAISDDTKKLLGILSDPNRTAVEAVSDIHNSTLAAAVVLVTAAATMERTMQDLYTAETYDPGPTPMELLAEGGDSFQEAESLEDGTGEDAEPGDNEMEDE